MGIAGCAHYRAAPLAAGADLAPGPGRLKADPALIRLAPLRARPFDPSRPLGPTEVAILAVLNSPDLAAKRAAAKVAAAQVFSAGLLPDPQLTFTADVPTPGSGAITAYNLNPNLDLAALISRSAALRAARAAGEQTDLDLLWAEWSTAQQARQLAVTIVEAEAKAKILTDLAAEARGRRLRSQAAFARRDATSLAVSADLAVELDAEGQSTAAVRDAAKARGDLDALIGLAPGVVLALAPAPETEAGEVDAAGLDAALAALPRRRPDLLALQAGYRAQDATLRHAILLQFPLINLGYSRQRDNTGINSNGVSGVLTLPLFNRQRGEIAVQSATRERLAAEYQARLDQTVADVAAARRDLALDEAALGALAAKVPALTATVRQARIAADRGDLDSAALLALEQSALKAEVARLDARLALALADIGLRTVLFLPADSETAS